MIKADVYTLKAPFELIMEEQIIDPSQLGPTELIAKTVYSVVSPGTEVAAYSGASPLRPMKVYPRVVGYCNIARVEFTGTGVSSVSSGDYILTFQSHRTYFKINESECILKFDQGSPLKKLTATYLYHLGYAALLSGEAKPGYTVGIIGAGTLGYTSYELSAACGFNTVIFSAQKELVSTFKNNGIKGCLKDNEAVSSSLKNLNTDGFDIVINTSNSWHDWLLALQIVRKSGSVINLGFPGRDQPIPDFNPLDSRYLYDKQITIKSTGHMPDLDISASDLRFTVKRNMQYLAGLITENRLDPSFIISSVSPFSELDAEYKKMLKRDGIFFTSLLEWE
ncbi:zinc-binding dehydrogenase [Terrimonas sp. NA20]|uniref:Zinc-binding dehydrogenase n=1 Tax=Terrimonas ginsenosidimutans TaxID=2908004 RepID=A0ABS9KUR3_9BACT|nr:zinc-binding dehydrogenase [Terrimonas ginsenosidimutans]MCG2616068.1 zinc-binding dehydrogenase [Terrimonas ginsenosidimutans]